MVNKYTSSVMAAINLSFTVYFDKYLSAPLKLIMIVLSFTAHTFSDARVWRKLEEFWRAVVRSCTEVEGRVREIKKNGER